tara:strand:+ start:164 stop:559 length:396 start_codon:yes stop_codon:yes gene_type:complete
MSVLDKLKFWKKHDAFDFDELTSQSANTPGAVPKDDLGLGPSALDTPTSFDSDPFKTKSTQTRHDAPSSFSENQSHNQSPSGISKTEVELLSSKLDTIKAILQSLDQRIAHIEQIAKSEQNQKPKDTNHLW